MRLAACGFTQRVKALQIAALGWKGGERFDGQAVALGRPAEEALGFGDLNPASCIASK